MNRAPRVVVCENCLDRDDPALARLTQEGYEVFHCTDCEELLEEVVARRPAAVIYQVRADCTQDLGILRLFRRVAPDVPLVLLSAEGSLATQRLFQSLRPIYFAVLPVEPTELCDAVRVAAARSGAQRVQGPMLGWGHN